MKCLGFTCFLANNLALIHLSLNCISATSNKVRSHHLEIIEEGKNTVEIVMGSWPWECKLAVYQLKYFGWRISCRDWPSDLLQGSGRRFSGILWTHAFFIFYFFFWLCGAKHIHGEEELMESLRTHSTSKSTCSLGLLS